MNPIYYLDAVLVLIAYLAITDENAMPFFVLKFKIALLFFRKQWLLLRMKPDLWLMKWRMKRTLKKLQQDQELRALVKEHQEIENARNSDSNLR